MERISFIFTICFVLLGPVKIIPAFARITPEVDRRERRRLAVFGVLIAAAICLFVVVLGRTLITTYELSLEALQLGGGLVLLLAALDAIFPRAEPKAEQKQPRSTLQLAIAPLAVPIIVPPAGVAALLIIVMSAPRYPGVYQALGLVLLVILLLDFLVMLFNSSIVRIRGLLSGIQVIGSVLVFIQVALAIEAMLTAIRTLGLVVQ